MAVAEVVDRYPRKSKCPIFEVSGSKNHLGYMDFGARNLNNGTWILWATGL